jgi:hypothetical protein
VLTQYISDRYFPLQNLFIFLMSELDEATERVCEPHVLDRRAVDVEEPRRAQEVGDAPRPRRDPPAPGVDELA